MLFTSATFISGFPATASSPACAYLASTVPSIGEQIRHLASCSSSCPACARAAAICASILLSELPSALRCASSCFSSTVIAEVMSSSCFSVVTSAFIRFSTRCLSRCCLASCSSRGASCSPISGRLLSNARMLLSTCSRCRCSWVESMSPTCSPLCTGLPSLMGNSRMRPFTSLDTTTSVASKLPVASYWLRSPAQPPAARSVTAAKRAALVVFMLMVY